MDRTKARLVREAIEKALTSLDPALKVSVEVGSGRFSDTELTLKLIALDKEAGGASNKAEADFNKYAKMYGLEASLSDVFMSRGKTFKVAGLKPRSRKYPVICERMDGKRFKFSIEEVNMHVKMSGRVGI